jgi:hypothetical protein
MKLSVLVTSILLGVCSAAANADKDTTCDGPNMTYAEASNYFSGTSGQQLVGPYNIYYRMRSCDGNNSCTNWLYQVAYAPDNRDAVYLAKGVGSTIEVFINYMGSMIDCGSIGSPYLECKDPTSYLSYKGYLTNHCFRMVAHEAKSINDGLGDYDDGEDILFGNF